MSGYLLWARGEFASQEASIDSAFWPPLVDSCFPCISDSLSCAAPISVSRFVEAVVFLAHTFVFAPRIKQIGDNRFLTGKGQKQLQRLGMGKRAEALGLDDLATIEAAVYFRTCPDVVTVVFEALCHLCCTTARLNDLAEIIRYQRFKDSYEIESIRAKTAATDGPPIVVVAPLETLSGLDWSSRYNIFRREELGIPLEGGPIFS